MAAVSTVGRQAIRRFAEHEHEELAAGIDRIHELGEEMARLPVDRRAAGIRWVLHWIDADLKPHMAWEESWLFPQIDVRARTPWATRVQFGSTIDRSRRKPNDCMRTSRAEAISAVA